MSLDIVAAVIIGISSVIDGDTLEIHGQRIRLHGVDAPESRQVCMRDGKPWRCGQAAAAALADHLAGVTVTCEPVDKDRYGRTVADCFSRETSVAGWLVEQGWALDWPQYSHGAYAQQQAAARGGLRGVWASEFEAPWEWRRHSRAKSGHRP